MRSHSKVSAYDENTRISVQGSGPIDGPTVTIRFVERGAGTALTIEISMEQAQILGADLTNYVGRMNDAIEEQEG
jgi:hypothetical protein